jgi:hypothetical protein
MPSRPRQHELEDESRIAFEAALPSGWVYRQQPNDYGLDGVVEVFESGQTTGILFWVQLKSTDDAGTDGALKFRLSLDHCDYYRSLDMPVLVLSAKWELAFRARSPLGLLRQSRPSIPRPRR